MIKAKVIANSISAVTGDRMVSLEIEYPRFILAELNTHRMLSKNSASSRAIPVARMLELVRTNPASPVFWGKNKAGMQATEELTGQELETVKRLWLSAANSVADFAEALAEAGLHKQHSNRPVEFAQVMKTVISGTEWANLYHLRKHSDAQPEFNALATAMYDAVYNSSPVMLYPGEWHLPYIECVRDALGKMRYYVESQEVSLDEAKMISASCCAQVSYRKEDYSLDKAKSIYDKLINSQPCHSSPVEHQATPMDKRTWLEKLTLRQFTQDGITHVDRHGNRWSGNLRGWIQHRKLIPGEAVW